MRRSLVQTAIAIQASARKAVIFWRNKTVEPDSIEPGDVDFSQTAVEAEENNPPRRWHGGASLQPRGATWYFRPHLGISGLIGRALLMIVFSQTQSGVVLLRPEHRVQGE